VRFARTGALEQVLGLPRVRSSIGIDLSLALRYRPRLDEHVAFSLGAAGLVPGDGFSDLEPALCVRPGCADAGKLWSTFVRLELTY